MHRIAVSMGSVGAGTPVRPGNARINEGEHMRKAVMIASAFALAAPMFLVGTASQAHAGMCVGSGCTGHSAASEGCTSDGETIYSVNISDGSENVGNIQLKYSPSCRATWARVVSNLTFGSFAEVESNSDPTLAESCMGGDTAGTGCNTAMINDENITSFAFANIFTGFAVAKGNTPSF
jgi:hypothetical protein